MQFKFPLFLVSLQTPKDETGLILNQKHFFEVSRVDLYGLGVDVEEYVFPAHEMCLLPVVLKGVDGTQVTGF